MSCIGVWLHQNDLNWNILHGKASKANNRIEKWKLLPWEWRWCWLNGSTNRKKMSKYFLASTAPQIITIFALILHRDWNFHACSKLNNWNACCNTISCLLWGCQQWRWIVIGTCSWVELELNSLSFIFDVKPFQNRIDYWYACQLICSNWIHFGWEFWTNPKTHLLLEMWLSNRINTKFQSVWDYMQRSVCTYPGYCRNWCII